MFPDLRIFKREGCEGVLRKLLDLGFSPLVDSVNESVVCLGQNKVYGCLLVSWNQGWEVEWEAVDAWVKFYLNGEGEESETVKRGDKLMLRPTCAEQIRKFEEEEVVEDVGEDYEFRMSFEGDHVLYEVKKPFTDRPYCVVVRNWNGKHEDLFSGLFVCSSWGVSGKDHLFLTKLWKFLEVAGEPDLEEVVRKRVARCVAGEDEPEVYRSSLEKVVELLRSGGCGHFPK